MAKYRLLSKEELNELEKEFIEYLVLNGIDADKWEALKKDKPAIANKTVELFSDVVFEKILRQAKFIKKVEPQNLIFIKCNEKNMNMIALNNIGDQTAFTKYQIFDFHKIIEHAELVKGNKAYTQDRQQELFMMLEKGFEIDDGENYNKLELLLKEK